MENAKLQKIENDHKNKYKSYNYSSTCTICFTKRKVNRKLPETF